MSASAGTAERLGVSAAAKYVGLSRDYVYKAIQTGKLAASRDEKGVLVVNVADLEPLRQALEAGVGPGDAAERAGMSWHTLHRLQADNIVVPSIRQQGFADGPRSRLWSDADIRALETYTRLHKAGVSRQAIKTVGANLCRARPELVREDAALNDALGETKLQEQNGDVVERVEGGFVSWLHLPREKLASDPKFVGGFGEQLFIPSLKKQVKKNQLSDGAFRQYVRKLRQHVFPTFGPFEFSQIRRDHVRDFRAAKAKQGLAPETVDDYEGLLKRLLTHAQGKSRFTGDLEALFAPSARTAPRDELARDVETVVRLAKALEADLAFAIWYLLAAFLGLRPREISALRWRNINYTETDGAVPALRLELRSKFVNGKLGDLSQREVRAGKRPLPQFLAGMLRRWHNATDHKELDDLVFPNKTGNNAIDPKNVYHYHLNKAAAAVRKAGHAVNKFEMSKLRRTAMAVADQAEIGVALQHSVLRLQKTPEVLLPSDADFGEVRDKHDRLWARLHGEDVSVTEAAKPKGRRGARRKAKHEPRPEIAAKRQAGHEEYKVRHPGVGPRSILKEAGVSPNPSELSKYLHDRLPRVSATVSNLNKLFFGDEAAT